jgi:hypothetical protein
MTSSLLWQKAGCPIACPELAEGSRFWDMGFRRAIALPFALLLCTLAPPLHAQGCAQCLDNTAATPPATQRAYRHAIILLTLTAGGLFVTTLYLFKRHR